MRPSTCRVLRGAWWGVLGVWLVLSACQGPDDSNVRRKTVRVAPGVDASVGQQPLELTLQRPDVPEEAAGTRVLVLGFLPSEVDAASLLPARPPVFRWDSGSWTPQSWPVSLSVPIPDNLWPFAVLDVDGNGVPSIGDQLAVGAAPVDRRRGTRLTLLLDGALEAGDPLVEWDFLEVQGPGALPQGAGGIPTGAEPPLSRAPADVGPGPSVASADVGPGPSVASADVGPGPSVASADVGPGAARVSADVGPGISVSNVQEGLGSGMRRPSGQEGLVVGVQPSSPQEGPGPEQATGDVVGVEVRQGADRVPWEGVKLQPRSGALVVQSFLVEAAEGLPLPPQARVLITGFDPSGIGRASPVFVWARDRQAVDWPLSVEAAVPEGMHLVFSLDQQQEGAPVEAGPYSSVLRRFAPASDAAAVRVVLDQEENPFRVSEVASQSSPPTDRPAGAAAGADVGAVMQSPEGATALPAEVTVYGLADWGPTWSGRAFVIGWQNAEDSEAIALGPPAFLWRSAALESTWPLKLTLSYLPGADSVLVLDASGDGRPGPGDLAGAPWKVGRGESFSSWLVVDRPFEPSEMGRKQSVGEQSPPMAEGPEPSPEPTGVLRPLQIEASQVVGPGWDASVFVVGYPVEALVGGLPQAGEEPAFFWRSVPRAQTFPLELELPLPEGLALLVLLDRDEDGGPSPGDWVSAPVLPDQVGPSGPVVATVAKVFWPEDSEPDEAAQEAVSARSDTSSAPALEQEWLGRGQQQAAVRTIRLDTRPRAPFLREGMVMVLGYPDGAVVRGMPRGGIEPTFFWRSDVLQLRLPLEVHVPLPRSGTVFVVLDLDDSRTPGPGDLSTRALTAFTPPALGEVLDVVVEKAFGLHDLDEGAAAQDAGEAEVNGLEGDRGEAGAERP